MACPLGKNPPITNGPLAISHYPRPPWRFLPVFRTVLADCGSGQQDEYNANYKFPLDLAHGAFPSCLSVSPAGGPSTVI
jgi:hypothetical protein